MDKTSLFVLLAALLYTCDGFTDGSGTSWLSSFQSAMKRQARDVDAATDYNSTTDFDACERARTCFHEGQAMRTLGPIMYRFSMSEIYPNAGILCGPRPDCRIEIEGCNDTSVGLITGYFDNVFRWICNNQTGFRDAAACFQPPFPERVSSCMRVMRNPSDMDHGRSRLLQRCVHSEVGGLTACTDENKRFYLSFFDYLLEEQMRIF